MKNNYKIYKYEIYKKHLTLEDSWAKLDACVIKPLCIQQQRKKITFWALVDPQDSPTYKEQAHHHYKVHVLGTGTNEFVNPEWDYIGTEVLGFKQDFVLHFFGEQIDD